MKSTIYIVCLSMLSILSACSSGPEPIYFVTIERDFVIPANLSPIPTHFFELKTVETLFDEHLSINGRKLADVASVGPGDASLSAVFENVDWTFVDGVEVYMISRNDPTKKQRIFYTNQADYNNRGEVRMFNTLADIKDIVSEGLVDLEVRINTQTFVPTNIRARLKFNYAVFEEL